LDLPYLDPENIALKWVSVKEIEQLEFLPKVKQIVLDGLKLV